MLRTRTAGSLRAEHTGQTVTLTGWVDRRRDHGGVAFIDLRDASGIAQVVIRDEAVAHPLRNEFVLQVTGEVSRRPDGNENPSLPTGEIEVVATDVVVLNTSEALPFQVSTALADTETIGEEARLKHRYLDLRRPPAHALRLRAKANQAARRARRRGVRRDRDADAHPLDARGRARLPRARAPRGRLLVRAAAVAPAVQAAPHGRGHGALLPDRTLLPRRGLPRRPPARVHAARRRDELRRAGRRHRARREDPRRAVGAHRADHPDAHPAHDLPRRHAALRLPDKPDLRFGNPLVQLTDYFRTPRSGLPGRVRRRRRHGGRGLAAASSTRGRSGPSSAALAASRT